MVGFIDHCFNFNRSYGKTSKDWRIAMKKFNYYAGIFYSSIVLTLLIIIAEFVEPFKNLLKSTFYHHWIGKIVITIIVFILIGLFYKKDPLLEKSPDKISFQTTIICLAIILLFFIFHYFL